MYMKNNVLSILIIGSMTRNLSQQVQKRGRGRPTTRGSTSYRKPYHRTPSTRGRKPRTSDDGLSVEVPSTTTFRAVSTRTRRSTAAFSARAYSALSHQSTTTSAQNSSANLPEGVPSTSTLRSATASAHDSASTVRNYLANLPEGVPSTSTLRTASNNPLMSNMNSQQMVDTVARIIQTTIESIIPQVLQAQQAQNNTKPRPCSACWENTSTHAFLPCGHLVLCEDCAGVYLSLENDRCNVCRKPFDKISGVEG